MGHGTLLLISYIHDCLTAKQKEEKVTDGNITAPKAASPPATIAAELDVSRESEASVSQDPGNGTLPELQDDLRIQHPDEHRTSLNPSALRGTFAVNYSNYIALN